MLPTCIAFLICNLTLTIFQMVNNQFFLTNFFSSSFSRSFYYQVTLACKKQRIYNNISLSFSYLVILVYWYIRWVIWNSCDVYLLLVYFDVTILLFWVILLPPLSLFLVDVKSFFNGNTASFRMYSITWWVVAFIFICCHCFVFICVILVSHSWTIHF